MMEDLIWKPEYSVGVKALDDQHKVLIGLINRLNQSERDHALIGWVFNELEAYTKEHFSFEEKLLAQANYEHLKTHKKEHKVFKQWLSAVRQSYSMGMSSPTLLSSSVNAFLNDWLIKHILSSDMDYKDTLASLD